jgi:hypothetical protein
MWTCLRSYQYIETPYERCYALLTSVQSTPPAPKPATPTDASAKKPSTNTISGDIYIEDGDYIKDIEVNDLRNRYTLTKGSTQKMVNTHLTH